MGDLTKNFSRSEFACKCGCGFDTVDYALVVLLQEVRDKLCKVKGREVPVHINSGCRCENYNATLPGSAVHSQHTYGRAADVWAEGVGSAELCLLLFSDFNERAKGIGKYATWVHIDTRSGPKARWE